MQDDPDGVLVCLQCFNGGCVAEGRRHAFLHSQKREHPLGVVIKRTRKEQKQRVSEQGGEEDGGADSYRMLRSRL